ncbi:recombinase family protein [Salipiger marinus]|uniref:Site-specific DNA recombinase n=1 Tax=Salipiger marinus TaxID=555512 RepID=A0A1G8U8B9_9RHOB|nr:recombinase family protein [Salipiger marinus]SDJ49969.1 Site-specific DNA recombinase [Salipiger marinus]
MLVGYARVSTQDQNPNLQSDALKAAGCEKIFVEKASGAQRERPDLTAALSYMREGDSLVVWKLDRLARSLPQLIETVARLEAQGIGFRSLTEAIDTTTAGGKLVFHIFGALAEFERSVIRERTRAGLKAARDRGRTGGRPPALSPADLAAAKAMLGDPAITVDEVAKRLKVSPATLYRHLPGGRSSLDKSGGNNAQKDHRD